MKTAPFNDADPDVDMTDRERFSQQEPTADWHSQYDFIVCGAGASGSVIARRLAEHSHATVLLLEAGGDDDVPNVWEPNLWPTNIGSERDWGFQSEPNQALGGRVLPMSMGKVLGGGSSINATVWARGHRSDWDYFASESGDPAWSYASVLDIYRSIEDWHGDPDPNYRGAGGPVFVQPAPYRSPLAFAVVEGAGSIGVPPYENPNGRMMEAEAGASICDVLIRDGKRESLFRSYTFPYRHSPNLTVLAHAVVRRLNLVGNRVVGVEVSHEGQVRHFRANTEVILSLGAIHTPKVLMLSGIGDEQALRGVGIPVRQHLPGVGANLHDHLAFDCVWEFKEPAPQNYMAEAVLFWRSTPELEQPDLFACQGSVSKATPENVARFGLPERSWVICGALTQPRSRGRLRLTGADAGDPIAITANALCHPEDLHTAIACIEAIREVGNSVAVRPFVKREVMPGNLKGAELTAYIRDAAISFWHLGGTAKMGRDAMAVVDSRLKVYGIENLRVADASIMPRVTTGNTMAPCVVIGERAGGFIKSEHLL
jgi:choline dehydrogenase